MNSRRYLIGLIFLVLAGHGLAATKSDQAKEKRWEEQIVPSLLVGEAVKLKAADVEFLGLYADNTAKQALGGIILIHGIGAHPAWPEIIEPLRTTLPEHGWSTMSLQMPILGNEANAQDYLQRCEKHRDHRAQHGHEHGQHLSGKQTGPGRARLCRHRHE